MTEARLLGSDELVTEPIEPGLKRPKELSLLQLYLTRCAAPRIDSSL